MLLILLKIRISNDSFFDGFHIYLIDNVGKEVNCYFISLINIHYFVAFLHICNVAIDHITHKLIYVQFWNKGSLSSE